MLASLTAFVDPTATHLENQELERLVVLVAVGEVLDLLAGVVEERVEVLVAPAQDLEARLVERGRLRAAGLAWLHDL